MYLNYAKENILICPDYIRAIYLNDRGKVTIDLGDNTEYVLESYSLKDVLLTLPEKVIDVDVELDVFEPPVKC